jgi:hypothetical protein
MTSTDGDWDTAQPAQFPGDDIQINVAEFSSVSCSSPGNCTAVGSFRNSDGNTEAFTMTSEDGEWDYALPAQFDEGVQSENPDAEFNSVSCPTDGNCTAVGQFENIDGNIEAFTMTSEDGEWDYALPAQFEDDIKADVQDEMRAGTAFIEVSCSSPGNCTAVGGFRNMDDNYEAFTMTSIDGEWGLAQPAQFDEGVQSENPDAEFNSVSCPTDENCTAVGSFTNSDGNTEAFTMTSTGGEWNTAQPAQFSHDFQSDNSNLNEVSCSSPGYCIAVGSFTNSDGNTEAFTMTSIDGEWDTARPAQFEDGIQSDEPYADFTSVSCPTDGNCTAVGSFTNSAGHYEAFTMTSIDGEWGLAQPAQFEEGTQNENPYASFSSVSCASPGNCTAVGSFRNSDGNTEAFTMTSTGGEWDYALPAQFDEGVQSENPDAEFNSVSCPTDGNCTAVGYFRNIDNHNELFTMT